MKVNYNYFECPPVTLVIPAGKYLNYFAISLGPDTKTDWLLHHVHYENGHPNDTNQPELFAGLREPWYSVIISFEIQTQKFGL